MADYRGVRLIIEKRLIREVLFFNFLKSFFIRRVDWYLLERHAVQEMLALFRA